MQETWIGSRTTPTAEAVSEACARLKSNLEKWRPGRNGGFERMARFHNALTAYTAFYLAFACGARRCHQYRWNASLNDGHWFTYFPDKVTQTWRMTGPMLLPSVCIQQISLFKAHCQLLLGWIRRRGTPCTALDRRLATIAASGHADLLFYIANDGPRAVGSKSLEVVLADPLGKCVGGDSGRHYFSSFLYRKGVEEFYIDVYLRHTESGVEASSSTAVVALRRAYMNVCPLIDEHMLGLGLLPTSGLRKVT